MTFHPGEWIERPGHYVTVGMKGTVSEDLAEYSGIITHTGCGEFRVRRR